MHLKTKIISLLTVLLSMTSLFGQKESFSFGCYTDYLREQELKERPELQQIFDQRDLRIRQNLPATPASAQRTAQNTNPIIIPVLVQIIHNNGSENITDQQVFSQITALNNAFQGQGIEFCLATARAGNALNYPGSTTPGILRRESNYTVHAPGTQDEIDMKLLFPNFDPNNYLRVWVVDSIVSAIPGIIIGGYSRLPGGVSPVLDGVVVRADAFGEITACGSGCHLSQNNTDGDVMVHEVGHYLGLYHTFEGGCSGMTTTDCDSLGDQVCDTPPVAVSNSGCPSGMNSCAESLDFPDLIDNYMDYTSEACRASFTTGQANRMLTAISLYRSGLSTALNHAYTGINCSAGLAAFFTANKYTACLNENITFIALNQSGATYHWDLGDTVLFGQVVSHSFASAHNPLDVELTVFLNGDSASTSIPFFIEDCSPIVDPNSTWFFGREDGVNFTSGVAAYDNSARINGSINTNEPSAIQGDASGNLLFFTDGRFVYDANHNLVNTNPNDTLTCHESTLRGTLIIPDPANANEYYIFYSTANFPSNTQLRGFSYSKVSVAANGTVSMLPNLNTFVPLPPGGFFNTLPAGGLATGEAISAVEYCDGYWLLCTADSASKKFLLTYQVSSTGISYVGATDILLAASSNNRGRTVNICPSPNGNKVAVSSINHHSGESIGLRVLEFDKQTGSLGNILLEDNFIGVTAQAGYYGLSFSPNSKLLYANTRTSHLQIVQYNLNSASPLSTRTDIGYKYVASSGQMQLGPDNKIYITGYSRRRLAVIHRPNEVGLNCLYSDYGPTKPFTSGGYLGALPNIIDATISNTYDNTISSQIVNCTTFRFQPNLCGQTFSWNFGDAASGANNTANGSLVEHNFSGPGTYIVSVANNFGTTISDTIVIDPVPAPEIIGITCDSLMQLTNYSTNSSASSYQWTVSGGTIAGLSTISKVDVVWNTFPATTTLTVTDENECSNSSSLTVTDCSDNCPCDLNAGFVISKNGCEISFRRRRISALCGTLFSTWTIQGAAAPLYGSSGSYTFPQSGNYEICHRIEVRGLFDQVICFAETCEIVEVIDCSPGSCEDECEIAPDIKVERKNSCTFNFEGLNNGKDCASQQYEWLIYNSNGTLVNQLLSKDLLNYTFPASGMYTVCLNIFVEKEDGSLKCEKQKCVEVEVECERCDKECSIKPVIKVEKENSCEFDFFGFNDDTPCPAQIFEWTIYNGAGHIVATHTGQAFNSFLFPVSGVYRVCLEIYVLDDKGMKKCKEMECINLEVSCESCEKECDVSPDIKPISEDNCTFDLRGINNGAHCPSQVYQWHIYDENGNLIHFAVGGDLLNYTFQGQGPFKICLTIVVYKSDGSIKCQKERCIELGDLCSESAGLIAINATPNPADHQLTFDVINKIPDVSTGKISLYDMYGNIVMEKTILLHEKLTVDVSSLPIGSYFYQLTTDKHNTPMKTIIVVR